MHDTSGYVKPLDRNCYFMVKIMVKYCYVIQNGHPPYSYENERRIHTFNFISSVLAKQAIVLHMTI